MGSSSLKDKAIKLANNALNSSQIEDANHVEPETVMFTCYQCNLDECKEKPLPTCSQALVCLTSTLESEDEGLEHKRGCLTSATEVYFSCNKPSYRSSTHQFSFQCCKGDLCNGKDFPRLPPLSADLGGAPMGNSAMTSDLTFSHYLPILGVVGLLTLIFLVVVGYIMVTLHRRMAPSGKYLLPYHSKGADTSCGSYLEHSVSSGSGTGVPLLNRKTLGQKIELKECIGKGRFGSVYRGLMQGDEVSVKIFNSEDEMSFKRETEVYSIVLIRHDNVLCFLGSDILFERANVELWLVTAFHPLGSLHDFLTSCADVVEQGLDPDHAMDLVRSAVAGITHLHTEICGTSGKPAIAHRDIKSKNIILKTPRHCLIADFGLAVIRHDKNKEVSEADLKSSRVGTRRYMAPEVLALTMNKYKFQTYRQADIYSLGLVLWEIARCARNPTTGDGPPGHRLPYFNKVPSEPTLEDMQRVVCGEKYRPSFPSHFLANPVLKELAKVIPQCWKDDCSARLSALRVKKTLHLSAEALGLS